MRIANSSMTVHSGATSYIKAFAVSTATNRKIIALFTSDSTELTVANVRWGGSTGARLTRVAKASTQAGTLPTAEMWELSIPAFGTLELYWETGATTAHHATLIELAGAGTGAVLAADVLVHEPNDEVTESELMLVVPRGAAVLAAIAVANSGRVVSAAGDLGQLWNDTIPGILTAAAATFITPSSGLVTSRWTLDGTSHVAHVLVVLRAAASGYGNSSDGYVGLTIPTFDLKGGTNLGISSVGSLTVGSAAGIIAMSNTATLPASLGASAGFLYVRSGHLWYRGATGTLTQVASA